MKQITTKSGFEITVDENAADDFELLEMLSAIDKHSEYTLIRPALSRLIGADGFERLTEHVKTDGRVPITALLVEMGEIVRGFEKK